jgi:hypothetical protein
MHTSLDWESGVLPIYLEQEELDVVQNCSARRAGHARAMSGAIPHFR